MCPTGEIYVVALFSMVGALSVALLVEYNFKFMAMAYNRGKTSARTYKKDAYMVEGVDAKGKNFRFNTTYSRVSVFRYLREHGVRYTSLTDKTSGRVYRFSLR